MPSSSYGVSSEKSRTSQISPTPTRAKTYASASQTFLGNELAGDRVEEAIRNKREDDINAKAEQWIQRLRGDRLKPMTKAIRRVVAATTYNGEPSPIAFTAWKESIYSFLPIYDVSPGPSQVQVTTWFIRGKAKE